MMKKRLAAVLTCTMAMGILAGCGGGSASTTTETKAAAAATEGTTAAGNAGGGDAKLTMSWWGNQVRNERTQGALDLYTEQNPGVVIEGQFSEWSDYWNKLATSAAGQAIPDLVQMDYMYLNQYVESDLLVDLTPYIEDGTLDVSNISENTMASGMVDGGIYAICAGINSPSLLYNKTLMEANGIEVKDHMTLDEFFDVCRTVYEKTGVKTNIAYGICESWSSYFMRAYDMHLFEGKEVGGTAESYIPFFEQYTRGLEEGWLIDPSVFAEISLGSVEQEPLVYGTTPETQSWCAFYNSNQLAAMQKAAPEGMEIGITTWPSADPVKSGYLKSSQFFSIGAHTKNVEEAVKVLNFLTNSSEANNILLGERGVPASSVIAEEIAPKMSEQDQTVIAFINDVVTPKCSPIDPPQPDGSSEVYNMMNQLVEKVCYGQLDATAAAQSFYDEAVKIMASKQ